MERVAVLQYGDDPEIEPGELLARVILQAGESEDDSKKALRAFDEAQRGAHPARKMRLARPPRGLESTEGQLTPVMARLGPDDLETVDTLITAGIAGNRADAVRWALARIRERPAYEKLRERAREIEELKAQF